MPTTPNIAGCYMLRPFARSAFPANRERQEVTWSGPCRQVRGLIEVHVLPQGFFSTLKHNPTFEKKYDFLELFCLVIIEFYFKKIKKRYF